MKKNAFLLFLLLVTTFQSFYDPVNYVAFSYYNDGDMLNCYGMADWKNGVSEKSISMTTLFQRYTIIRL